MIRRPITAFSAAAYADAKAVSTDQIVRRYARGNVALQRGAYIDADELKRRSEHAITAMRNIEKMLARK